MTETPLPEEWLRAAAAIPYWAIALLLLIAVVIFAIFNVQAGQPTSNPSNIQKRFGLITWTRSAAHFIIGLWGCALALLIGVFLLTTFQLIQEILATSNQDTIRQLAIALASIFTVITAILAAPITWNRHHSKIHQNNAEVEALTTQSIKDAVAELSADKSVKITKNDRVLERAEPNIEVRIGSILALERIAQKNLDRHIDIMEMIISYVNEYATPENSTQNDQLNVGPRKDIKVAFEMIGRRTEDQYNLEVKLEKSFKINDAYLVGLDLEDGNWENLEFHHCDLSEASFPFFTPDRIYISCCNVSYAHIYIGEYGPSKETIFSGPRIYRSLININHMYTKKCWNQELLDSNFATEASMPSGNKHSIPEHWLPAGTPDEQIEKAWKEWLGWPTI